MKPNETCSIHVYRFFPAKQVIRVFNVLLPYIISIESNKLSTTFLAIEVDLNDDSSFEEIESRRGRETGKANTDLSNKNLRSSREEKKKMQIERLSKLYLNKTYGFSYLQLFIQPLPSSIILKCFDLCVSSPFSKISKNHFQKEKEKGRIVKRSV